MEALTEMEKDFRTWEYSVAFKGIIVLGITTMLKHLVLLVLLVQVIKIKPLLMKNTTNSNLRNCESKYKI